jgi:hypothetical protein
VAGPDNGAHVEQLHLNVLDRPSDAEGKAKWVNALAAGTRDRADVLLEFSEGLENVASMRGKVRPACDGSTNKRPRSRALRHRARPPAGRGRVRCLGWASWRAWARRRRRAGDLDGGPFRRMSRNEAMAQFSESPEHAALSAPRIDDGIWFA